MAQWAYYNNDFIPESDCNVAASDLALQRGYGLFDYFKTIAGVPLFLEAHLARFYRSAGVLRLSVGKEVLELKAILLQLIKRNALDVSGVRLTLTGGYSPDGFTPATPNLIITEQPLSLPTPTAFERGIALATYPYQRQLPHVKTIDYLMAIWLQPWLAEQRADDILYFNNNSLTECPRANFFMVTNDETIVTPAEHILKGITREQVLQLAGEKALERPVAKHELQTAREAFITSTTKGILPVTAIDGIPVNDCKPGPVTCRLAAALAAKITAHKQLLQV